MNVLECESNNSIIARFNGIRKIGSAFFWGGVTLFLILYLANQVQAADPLVRLAYWQLEEASGPTYADAAGTYDGTCAGACPTVEAAGQIGNAQLFDGATTGISVAANSVFDWGANNSFSIELWVKGDPGQTCAAFGEVMIGRADSGSGVGYWSVGCNGGDGTANFQLGDGIGTNRTLTSSKVIANGVWHHLVVVRDGTQNLNVLYVDGVEAASATQAYSGGLAPTSADITMGFMDTAVSFQGTIDEVAVYSGVLTESEIKTHYYLSRYYDDVCATAVPIMPLGDSITKGSRSTLITGYRKPLYISMTNALHDVDFVGSVTGLNLDFDDNHEGHSGWHAVDDVELDIYGKAYDFLVMNPAEVVLLQIGTNDILAGQDAASLVPEVGQILDEIDRYNERTTVVLAQITNLDPVSPTVTAFNDGLAILAATRIAAGDKIILVDNENALSYPDDLSNDGIHPNDSGYNKMAGVWFTAVDPIIPLCTPSAPAIYSQPATDAVVGEAYNYQVRATGNPVPTYTLTTAPSGMTIDEVSGMIDWTPTAAITVDVTVEAHNSEGSDPQSFVITAANPPPIEPQIISLPLTQATVGQPYSFDFEATGQPIPTYTLASGPVDMTMDEITGQVVWTPLTIGPVDVSVEAHNNVGFDSLSYTISVGEAPVCTAAPTAYWPLDETSGTTYDDFVGSYDAVCEGVCPTPTTGIVDGGQQFNGTNSGASVLPSVAFDWGVDDSFSIEYWMKGTVGTTCATSSQVVLGRDDPTGIQWWIGCDTVTGKAAFQLHDSTNAGITLFGKVVNDGLWHHVVGVRDGATDTNYLYVDSVSVVSGNYDYTAGFESVTASLNVGWFDHREGAKTFNFAGTVDELTVFPRALSATDVADHYNNGLSGVGQCDVPPVLALPPDDVIAVGQSYNYTLEATGYPTPTFALAAPPSGMTVDADTGAISWTPSISGTFTVTAQAENRAGLDEQTYTITVTGDVNIISSPVLTVELGEEYTYTVVATGSPAPTYSLISPPTPPDMQIDPNSGVITWTPTTTGVFDVVVEADNGVDTAVQNFTITVSALPAISTIADTETKINQLFSYQVQASGYPAPTYTVQSTPSSTITIDATGKMTWTPTATGTFTVTVQAHNTVGTDTEIFTLTVKDHTVFLPIIIR